MQKVQDDTRAPHGAGHRSLSARAAGRSRGSRPTGCCSHLIGRPGGRRRGRLPEDAILVARTWARPSCWTTTARDCAAWCWRRARRPPMSRSSRARSTSRWSAGCRRPAAAGRARRHVVVDGDHGQVFVRPGDDVRRPCRRSHAARAPSGGPCYAATARPAGGDARRHRRSRCNINAGLLLDLPHLADSGADGVGLYRTEIPFMVRARLSRRRRRRPRSTAASYEQAGGKPVVFRTLDIGGDKVLPYLARSRRGESGDGLARDPHRPRPAADAAPAAARAAARRRRPATRRHVPDGRRGRGVRCRAARCSSWSWRGCSATGNGAPRVGQGRRHARSAGAGCARCRRC